jgi:hypothetical protein
MAIESIDPRLADRRGAYEAEGIASMLVVPLQSGPELRAAITFYYRTPRHLHLLNRERAGLGRWRRRSSDRADADSQRRRRSESGAPAEAGAILTGSLDYHVTLERLAERRSDRTGRVSPEVHSEGGLERSALATLEGVTARRSSFLRAARRARRRVQRRPGLGPAWRS